MMLALLGLAIASATSPVARSWPTLDASHSRGEVDSSGSFWVPSTLASKGFLARADASLVRSPLRFQDASGQTEALIREVWSLDLGAAWSQGRLRLSAQAPLLLRTTSDALPAASGLGDARLDGRLVLLPGSESGVGIALAGGVGLPLGAAAQAQGADGISGLLGLVVDGSHGPVWVGGTASTVLRPQAGSAGLVQDDWLLLRGGVGLRAWEGGLLSLEASSQTELAAPWGSLGSHPTELLLNAYHRRAKGTVLRAAIGAGVSSGVGTPAWRAVLGIGHQEG